MEINYDNRLLNRAALFIRRRAASNLRSLPVREVASLLKDFVSMNFDLIANDIWLKHSPRPFSDLVSEPARTAFADALASSALFAETLELTLFPLVVIQVTNPFISHDFFLTDLSGLADGLLPSSLPASAIDPERFPPFNNREGRQYHPASWLGVWSADIATAKHKRAAILGAIALLPHYLERYTFSGRSVFGGHCAIKTQGGYSFSMGDSHTPPLMEDVIITVADHGWLNVLAEKLSSPVKDNKRQIRALEYYHRAWVPDAVRRFPTLFGALDAIYGDAGAATQAVIDAVGPVMGPDYNYERLKLLLSLRASVIHGGAPNVYESSSYHKYFEHYDKDAVNDLELIVARCLQSVIFGSAMTERPHTHADAIKARTGRSV